MNIEELLEQTRQQMAAEQQRREEKRQNALAQLEDEISQRIGPAWAEMAGHVTERNARGNLGSMEVSYIIEMPGFEPFQIIARQQGDFPANITLNSGYGSRDYVSEANIGQLLLANRERWEEKQREERRRERRSLLLDLCRPVVSPFVASKLLGRLEQLKDDEFGDEDLLRETDAWRARWEEFQRQRQEAMEADRTILCRLVRAAREHAEAVEVAKRRCRTWAEEETKRLWQPWHGWLVSYVPLGFKEIYELDGDFPVRQIFVVYYDEAKAGEPAWTVSMDGSTGVTVIGAFFDAKKIEFNQPTTDRVLSYHVAHRVRVEDAVYVVNVPPFIDAKPSPAPERPDAWYFFASDIMQGLSLRVRVLVEQMSWQDLAKADPAKLVEDAYRE